jgi:hypothetical protein
MPRHFEHWFRGTSVEAASRSSTSTPRGIRGALTMPVIRGGSSQGAEMSGRLGVGGSSSPELSARAEARTSAAPGGVAARSMGIDAIAAGGVEFIAAAGLSASTAHAAQGGCSTSGGHNLSVTVDAACGGGIEIAGSAEVQYSLEAASTIIWSLEGRPLVTSDLVATASGGVSAFLGAAPAQVIECVGSGGWSTGGAVPSVAAPSGRSFKYWRRGGVVGEVGHRRGDFAHRYRGWPGIASSGRLTGADAVGPAGAGAQFGGSAEVGVDCQAGPAAGGWRLGGIAGEVATSSLIGNGGIAIGGAGRHPELGVVYRIYSNGGSGGPVDYDSPIAEVSGLEWTSQALPAGSSFRFAVRAYDPVSGLQESNLDATSALVIDAEGRDATRVPRPPMGLRSVDRGGGRIRLEWAIADSLASNRATHYHVYLEQDTVRNFSSPIVVPVSAIRGVVASTELHGLLEGRLYAAVVRAANAHGEDGNVNQIRFTADHTPPARVDALSASLPPTTA